MKLASFDIFDTILIRKCGNPDVIFYLLSKKLFPNDKDMESAFFLWRKYADSLTASRTMGKEVMLADIYETVDSSFLNHYSSEDLILAEKEVESENLTVNPYILSLIQKKREEGFQIAFISDMYLDSNFLKNILKREGCILNEEKIYVSCEWNARKSSGKLYDIVKNELLPNKWIHFGDNKESDIKQAKRKGIKTVFVDTKFSPIELELNKSDRYEIKYLSGLCRWYRMLHQNDPFCTMAADFVTPVYLPYVLFILHEARNRNIKRIYFLSRDGYILMKAAEAIQDIFPEIELKYLFLSRQSLLKPYLCDKGADDYLTAITTIKNGSVDKMLNQLGINRQELETDYDIKFNYNRIKNDNDLRDFSNKIFNSNFTKAFQKRCKKQEEILLKYFEQEGLFENVKSAAVDIGWVGTSRLMINSILRKYNYNDLHTFYYGVNLNVLAPSAGSYTSCFKEIQLLQKATLLLENYCSESPYPSTIGYTIDDSGYIYPTFSANKQFEETKITKANENAIKNIINEFTRLKDVDFKLLYQESKRVLDIMLQNKVEIDYTPFLECKEYNNTAFAKYLTVFEVFKIIIFNIRVSSLDDISLKLTLPSFLYRIALKLMKLTLNVKLKFIKFIRKMRNSKEKIFILIGKFKVGL